MGAAAAWQGNIPNFSTIVSQCFHGRTVCSMLHRIQPLWALDTASSDQKKKRKKKQKKHWNISCLSSAATSRPHSSITSQASAQYRVPYRMCVKIGG